MRPQNYEMTQDKVRERFLQLKRENPDAFAKPLKFSWSNWGFGREKLETSLQRLQNAGIHYIELHGNHYGPDLGYPIKETKAILEEYRITCSGVCGMFSPECDLSSNLPRHRQAAIDYLKREIAFTAEMGGEYLLVVPAAVGRAKAYDSAEFERSVESLLKVADLFVQYGVKAAIEPIRSAETSLIHTVADAKRYIQAINHPGIRHINGDVYHMQSEETNISQAILDAGDALVNLHLADSNRCALGKGSMDLDHIIMALYLLNYNQKSCFVTPEPLGPGGDPYPAMNESPDCNVLDALVRDSVSYFRERERTLCEI